MLNLQVGSPVVYVDPLGVKHAALITIAHSSLNDPAYWPLINLVYVTRETSKVDQYGQQLERACSVSHMSHPHANGRYWYVEQ